MCVGLTSYYCIRFNIEFRFMLVVLGGGVMVSGGSGLDFNGFRLMWQCSFNADVFCVFRQRCSVCQRCPVCLDEDETVGKVQRWEFQTFHQII